VAELAAESDFAGEEARALSGMWMLLRLGGVRRNNKTTN